MTGSLSQTRGRPEPGRELDALIAEKVMGWTKARYAPYPPQSKQAVAMCWHRRGIDAPCSLPEFSTDIAAAWMVIDHMVDKGGAFGVWLAQTHESLALCQFQIGDVMHESEGVSFPHAICNAALDAIVPAVVGGSR